MSLTASQRNGRIVRAGLCWDCAVKTERAVGGWAKCPDCDRRWRITTGTLILERNPLPPDVYGKRARLLTAGQVVTWNVNTITEQRHTVVADDVWLIPVGSFTEQEWHTN